MIRWTDVPDGTVETRERYEALAGRAMVARILDDLRERGEYEPGKHAALDAEPLTADEWSEMLAYGHSLARYYAHPADLGRAVRAGMTWEQVAEAIGPGADGGAAKARAAYRKWAVGQRQLNAGQEPGSTLGMTADQYAEALALAAEPDATDPAAAEDARAAAVRELAAAGDARREVDARTRAAVLAGRAAGVSVRRCAELGQVSADTVNRWTEERARELLAEGNSETDVAAALGVRADTVTRWAKGASR